jgi:hypothetical protein
VLLLALVSAGATAATIAARTTRDASAPSTTVATSPHVGVSLPARPTTTRRAATTSGPRPTVTTGTLPVAPGPPSTAATTAPPRTTTHRRPREPAVRSWPRGHAGYTVVLQSLPEGDGRGAALAQAHRALRAGVTGVGVLLSSEHASLRPGYWVVFAGDFASPGAGQAAAARARARGYTGAYPARISG